MFTLKVQTQSGTLYELTDRARYSVVNIDGLTPPQCGINTTPTGLHDGAAYNSSHLNVRNLVITVVLEGDIEANRQRLYQIFPLHTPVKIFFRNQNRNVMIDGYVEEIAGNLFAQREMMQISLTCPQPYWRDTTGTTVSLAASEPVTITNTGDVSAGFTMRMEVSSSITPGVTLGETSEKLDAVFPYRNNIFLRPMSGGVPVAFDPSTQKIAELTVSTTDITDLIETVGIITKQDDLVGTNAEDYIRVELSENALNPGTYDISYNIASITGGSAENVECKVRTTTDISGGYYAGGVYFDNTNMNFQGLTLGTDLDPATDKYTVYGYYPPYGWFDLTSQCTIVGGTNLITAQFLYDIVNAGCREGKIVIYHDTTGADIRSTLTLDYYTDYRNTKTDWSANCYDSIPAGYDPAKDVPYINGIRITAADIEECYILQGGTVHIYTIMYGDPGNSVDFKYTYSLNGDDIRTYTEDQIYAGLHGTAFSKGVCIWNNTTDEWMYFKNTRFQLGDVVEIGTVPGNLYAKITERNGADVDISLLFDVYKNGTFFQLIPGENEIEITAASGSEYISAELTAEMLYGGV